MFLDDSLVFYPACLLSCCVDLDPGALSCHCGRHFSEFKYKQHYDNELIHMKDFFLQDVNFLVSVNRAQYRCWQYRKG